MHSLPQKARHLGVTYIDGEVTGVEREGGNIQAVRLEDGTRIACGALVNTSGASGGRALAEMAGVDIPVYGKKRCVFSFQCKGDVTNAPLLIDTTGTWCRPEGKRTTEGQQFICGGSPGEHDPESNEFEVDWSLFEEIYWPALAARVPAFEQIKPGRAWAGHYDMCDLRSQRDCRPRGGLQQFLSREWFFRPWLAAKPRHRARTCGAHDPRKLPNPRSQRFRP